MTAHDPVLVAKAAAALRSADPSDQSPLRWYCNNATAVLDAVADDLREQGAVAALRDAAHDLPAFTEGANREGTATWKLESARDTYSGAIEDACVTLTARADSIEAGEQL